MDNRKDVHPALAQPSKFINLKNVPADLHAAIKSKAALAGVTIEAYILDVLAKAVK